MAQGRQRSANIMYVAGAAREFPPDVQDWLSQTPHRPAACPHVYDCLALLAGGRRPAAIIVSCEAFDWDELEFFELAPRLCRDTRLFVAGLDYQQAKLEAAVAKGAEPFDAAILSELLGDMPRAAPTGPAGLLAGSLRIESVSEPPVMRPKVVPPLDPETPPAESGEAEAGVSPEPPAAEERPPVRLVSSAEFDESEAPVPFPWAPGPNRPQRTPPRSAPPKSDVPGGTRSKPVQPTMLTAEELAALLGRKSPGTDLGKAQEGRS